MFSASHGLQSYLPLCFEFVTNKNARETDKEGEGGREGGGNGRVEKGKTVK